MNSSSTAYLDALSAFGAHIDFSTLPPALREQTAWILADTLAAIIAGSAEPELSALSARLRTDAPGRAVLPGQGHAAAPLAAALINGTAGTFLEMDEGNRFSRGHPAVHVIPAVMALGQIRGQDANTFMSALLAGYEVGSRLGAAAQLRGSMHPHGTWGTIGAAAACARLTGQSPESLRETINIGSSLTIATSKRTMLEGGLVRNSYAGLSNHNGLLALTLAECGFSGERDGPGSLLGAVVSDHFDQDAVTRDLGRTWHVQQNYFKLHSCCRYNHGTLDAIDQIAGRETLPAAADIASIAVQSYNLAAELDDPRPRNTLAAKFSVPFAVATRIVHGHSRLSAFTWATIRDPDILALAERVQLAEDPAMTARLPGERPARVEIRTRDGRTLVGEVGVNRGDDAAPYTHQELRAKFLDLCERVWPGPHAEHVLDATLGLGQGTTRFDDWVALLDRPPVPGASA